MENSINATTWHNFKRLLGYAKPYKLGFIAAIIGMLATPLSMCIFYINLNR